MTVPLEFSVRRGDDGTTTLTAAGEIDMSNAGRFSEALGQAAGAAGANGAGGAGFVIDLTAVTYLDSAGLTSLLPYASRIKIRATHVLGPLLAVSGLAPVTIVLPAP